MTDAVRRKRMPKITLHAKYYCHFTFRVPNNCILFREIHRFLRFPWRSPAKYLPGLAVFSFGVRVGSSVYTEAGPTEENAKNYFACQIPASRFGFQITVSCPVEYVGSSDFPSGPPAKYSPGLAVFSFEVRMGSSVYTEAWPTLFYARDCQKFLCMPKY